MNLSNILVVDDDKMILTAVKMVLSKEQMRVTCAEDGGTALELLKKHRFDLMILDVMLPDQDGFEVLQTLRKNQNHIPVIMLSGKDEEYNKVLGLGFGADDYITKPFSVPLLVSKVKALIRRNSTYTSQDLARYLQAGPFRINRSTFQVYKGEEELNLTGKELALLQFFMENPKQVFTKEQLYSQIWGNNVIDDNTIMVYIRRLRNKIESDPSKPQYLKTVWGIGYQFDGKG